MSLNFSTTNLSNLKQCCTTWYSVLVIPMSVFLWPLSQKEKNFSSGFEPASLNNKDLFNTSATQPKVVKRVKLIDHLSFLIHQRWVWPILGRRDPGELGRAALRRRRRRLHFQVGSGNVVVLVRLDDDHFRGRLRLGRGVAELHCC